MSSIQAFVASSSQERQGMLYRILAADGEGLEELVLEARSAGRLRVVQTSMLDVLARVADEREWADAVELLLYPLRQTIEPDDRLVDRLIGILRRVSDPFAEWNRVRILRALGKIGGWKALAVIREYADTRGPLGTLAGQEAVRQLEALRRDPRMRGPSTWIRLRGGLGLVLWCLFAWLGPGGAPVSIHVASGLLFAWLVYETIGGKSWPDQALDSPGGKTGGLLLAWFGVLLFVARLVL